MLTFKEWIEEKDFAFHRIETLVFFVLASTGLTFTLVIPFIKNYYDNLFLHLSIWLIIQIIILIYWYYNRAVFPSHDPKKMNIVIAIVTENTKQKTRITHDFKKAIEKQLIKYSLDCNYSVTVLHNHLSRIVQNKINLFFQCKKANIGESADIKSFENVKRKLNAKFIIYGDLISRNLDNSTYCLSLEAMLFHSPTDSKNRTTMKEEFDALWKKEVSFLESQELTGFKTNAEDVFFTASYMLGLATFTDNNFLHGIEIWEGLEKFTAKGEFSQYQHRILKLKATSYLLQSRLLYFEGKIEESLPYINMYLALTPDEYYICLTEAINQVKLRNDPQMALEYINKAEKVARNDGTWRYSKFYLLIKLHSFDEAIVVLDEILNTRYDSEIDAVNQVISYNQACVDQDPTHYQSYFIIGCFIYKKLTLPLDAYDKLEMFIELVKDDVHWVPLRDRAIQYIEEIDKIIGLKKAT